MPEIMRPEFMGTDGAHCQGGNEASRSSILVRHGTHLPLGPHA